MSSIELAEPTPPSRPTPRAPRTLTGYVLRFGFWGLLAAIASGAIAWSNGWRPWPPPPAPAKLQPAPPRDPLADSARRAARSVVTLQTVGEGNVRNLGAGFVVGEGLIATSFHVISSATEAQVRFVDGRVFAVAGYAAALPERDLALLRLEQPPADLRPLALGEGLAAPATQVMAIGHPRGVEFSFVAGRISQRVRSSALPEDGARFVRRLTGASEDIVWLQHSALLAEGNSGGPLINERGEVVGVNTWISRETNANYALPVDPLAGLIARVSQETRPLAELARPDVQAAAIVARLNAARAQTLFDEAQRIGWLPSSTADYRGLQELALAMTAAQLPHTFRGAQADRDRAAELQIAVTRIEAQLREAGSLGAPDQITIVNEQARRVVRQPYAGVFCFGEVERVVEGDRGQRGMLLDLIGFDEPLFVPLDGQFLEPQPGEVYALFGANLSGEVVRYGDNPLKLLSAPVIVSRVLILIP